MSQLHKNIKLYAIFLEEILIKELSKFGLKINKDCSIDRYWLNDLETFRVDSDFSNYFIVLYLWSISPIDIIKHRHKIKHFTKEVYECKLKHDINTPVNNAVGWKV